VGRRVRGRVMRTLLRGRTIFEDGRPMGTPGGRLLKLRSRPSSTTSAPSRRS
jgi:hypothetical protein